VFSHDLREPVQQIERLARRGQTSDEGPAASALQHVLRSSERVNRMLDDMVEYLSVTSRSVSPGEVDLNVCLKQAMGNLRTVIEETHAQIRAPQLPVTSGDQSQLVHLFQNLLSNAIKFRGARPPVVTITSEPHGDQWLLGVHDNGIGIPGEFTERIFELGRRLHTREEYPGSGIGLALCRRIVERHGGRIWAESRNADGSTFYVLLPRNREDAVADSGSEAGPARAAREERP
jgi:light-regulated signal transduction histidine kinase (bacteriophytochrome)